VYHGLRLAVVVPAYNEADRIAATVSGIPAYVDEVIVVDDASQDATFVAARQAARGGLLVLRHPQNRGVGAAIATGYREALGRGCDVAVVMAGDGQMDPADLPALLAPIIAGRADYSKGNRFAHAELRSAMPALRRVGNTLLSLLSRAASGYWHVFDSQCGFTAATGNILERIDLDGLYPRYGYPNDLLARLAVAGARVEDVPVRPIYGPTWRSGIGLHTAIYPVLFVVLRSLLWRLWQQARARSQPDARLWPGVSIDGGSPPAVHLAAARGAAQFPDGDRSHGDSSSSSVSSSAGSSRAPRR
jgi:glycosyltransferase involved in cell wall biosynthesis